jgi:hypothetical protein
MREPNPTGKAALPPRRPQRYRETPEVCDAIRRLIRAMGQRLATEDPEGVLLLDELEREVRHAWTCAVDGIRRSGYTDRDIGATLGTTRQVVEQRWPRTKA